MSVSAYVLARALPAGSNALDAALANLPGGGPSKEGALAALERALATLTTSDFGERLHSVNTADLSPVMRNRLAALVEGVAHERGVAVPPWVPLIPPLENPHFRWPLRSLRPYQLRATRVGLKRRNIFDPSAKRGEAPTNAGAMGGLPPRLQTLQRHLAILELDVEFYFLGGALLHQAFAARPPTTDPRAMFKPAGLVNEACDDVARAEGWSTTWLVDTLREHLGPGLAWARFLDAPGIQAFTPPSGYALAMKVAAARSPMGAREIDDIRFLLRSMNLTTAAAALAVVTRYFAERYLPPEAPDLLARLLSE